MQLQPELLALAAAEEELERGAARLAGEADADGTRVARDEIGRARDAVQQARQRVAEHSTRLRMEREDSLKPLKLQLSYGQGGQSNRSPRPWPCA